MMRIFHDTKVKILIFAVILCLRNLDEANCMETIRDIRDKKILDFGSGIGVTTNYLAEHNDATAIEPDEDSVKERWADNQYTQIIGSTEELRIFVDETFDMIICHNVLEYYAEDKK